MSGLTTSINDAYEIAFSKFDQQLVTSLNTAENILANHKQDLTPEQICTLYLTICVCKMKMDYPDDVMPTLFEAEQIAVTENDKTLLFRCLNMQANLLYRSGNLQEAIQKLLNLISITPASDNKISIMSNLGVIYTSLGMFDKALEYLFETLRLYEKDNNNRDYVRSCLNIAKCYFDMNSYEKSIEYFNVAQEMLPSHPDDDSKMFLKVNLGLAYAHLGKFDEALLLLNEAVDLEKKLEFVKKKGSLTYDLGQVYELKGDYQTALKLYNNSLEAVRTTHNAILLVSVLNNKAGIHINLEEYSIAETLLQEAIQIAIDSKIPIQEQECLKKFAIMFQAKGMFQQALEYYIRYQDLNESIFNEKVKNGIIKYESNYLTEKLEQKAEIYRLHNVELVEKNSIISQNQKQLEQKQKELEAALADLSESNATKDKLFSIIAHDLRGPVSSLQQALQMILEGNFDQIEQDEMLNQLNEQTKFTFDLLENLLWWAQSQKEGFILNSGMIALNPIINSIKSIYQLIAQKKNVNIDIELENDLNLYADKDALSLIIRNLVSNAIKFSPADSVVLIKCEVIDAWVIIRIQDQGKGINPEIIHAVQHNLKIQSMPGTDSEKGMGLGLSLCYEFAAKMNGRIILDDACSYGTCFSLKFPKEQI